jgi:hypothetical protein
MELYTVFAKKGFGVNNPCLMDDNGDYIELKSGLKHSKNDYYHRKQFKAKIVSVDNINQTGMYHLSKGWDDDNEENNFSKKSSYLNCFITVEEAHYNGGKRIFNCLELKEYFSEDEIELINKIE